MLSLLICIACNAGIFFCFRSFQTFRVNTFQAITFNYITCVVIGLFFSRWESFTAALHTGNPWLLPAAALGLVFISTFYLMARTTQAFSMTVASIANKMSLVIPVLVSLLFLDTRAKDYTWLNFLGMAAALLSIWLSSVRKKDPMDTHKGPSALWYLPVLVFLFGGLIDTSLNYLNLHYVQTHQQGIFPVFIFLVAGIVGVIVLIVNRTRLQWRGLIAGILLGSINYFSMYFLLKGLSAYANDGALFFPLLNVGIIIFTAILSGFIFGERLTRLNITGLVLAVLAILLLSYQEILLPWN